MIAQFYVDAVRHSRNLQLSRVMERNEGGIAVLDTALDMGRCSGKTEAAFKLMEQPGSLNIYIGRTLQAANSDADRFGYNRGIQGRALMSIKQDLTTVFRGHRIEYQAVNLIFDECETDWKQRSEVIQTIKIAMRSSYLHPFPYIHVIRLGM